MMHYVKTGLREASRQPFSLTVLFLYQLLWTVVLYRIVESAVVPLLRSYPGHDLPLKNLQVYWAEAQFQLLKTDVSHYWIWTLAIVLLLQVLATPFLNAGVYAAFRNEESFRARSFVFGMRKWLKPFALIYFIQIVLMLVPLYWLIPFGRHLLFESGNFHELQWQGLPIVAGYVVYLGLIRLLFTFFYFGCMERRSVFYSLLFILKHILNALLIALVLFTAYAIAVGAVYAASLYWAGIAAVLLHLSFPLIKMIFRLWLIGSQYELWQTKKGAA